MLSEVEIKEGNQLLQDFMGGKNFKRLQLKNWVNDTTISLKGFHEDWNLLMQVKNKISLLSNQHHVTIFNTHSCVTVYNGGRGNNILYSHTENLNDSILSTWKAIVQYVKWHNKNFDDNFKFVFDSYVLK